MTPKCGGSNDNKVGGSNGKREGGGGGGAGALNPKP